jgi:malate dehydrogenase
MAASPIVAILGAGDLAGALAHKIASRDRFAEIRLIDGSGSVAAGKALDIRQAGPLAPFRTRVVGATDPAAARDASVLVLADGVEPRGEWQGDAGLLALRRLRDAAPHAPVVCAGAAQASLIRLAVTDARVARDRIVGSVPGAVASALAALVALEADASAGDVRVAVYGAMPGGAVVAWSHCTVAGQPIDRVLRPDQLSRLGARLRHAWPPGPYALASAAARVAEAIVARRREALTCLVYLDGEFHTRGEVAALPVRLGPTGVVHIVDPALSAQERVAIENGLAGLTPRGGA